MDGLIVKDTLSRIIHSGSNDIRGIYSGYISSSGNYLDFFIPCVYDDSLTSVTVAGGIYAYSPTTDYRESDFDLTATSLYNKVNGGIIIELKFNSTQTPKKPVTVFFRNSSTASFS